jgi:predicted RNA-binding protein YlxR (DUF448 family)
MKAAKRAKPARPQPQRTCVVCRQTDAKRTLIRIVRTATQGVQIDLRGKTPGRGAYLCQQASCWERAIYSSILQQALKTTLSEAEHEQLKNQLAAMASQLKQTQHLEKPK